MNNVRSIDNLKERELESGIVGGLTKGSWHEKYERSAWVYLGGLSYELTEGDLICVMSQWGEIEDIHLVREKDTGKSKGFAFIKYEDHRSPILAVDNFNGASLLGRIVRCDHVENYRLPKEILEKESEKLDDNPDGSLDIGAGHAYKGKELASQFDINAGVDLWGRPNVKAATEQPLQSKNAQGNEDNDVLKNHKRKEMKGKKQKKEKKRSREDKDEFDRRGRESDSDSDRRSARDRNREKNERDRNHSSDEDRTAHGDRRRDEGSRRERSLDRRDSRARSRDRTRFRDSSRDRARDGNSKGSRSSRDYRDDDVRSGRESDRARNDNRDDQKLSIDPPARSSSSTSAPVASWRGNRDPDYAKQKMALFQQQQKSSQSAVGSEQKRRDELSGIGGFNRVR